jgi:hypothetical protein
MDFHNTVELLFYAPVRPPMDLSVIFLWMMAVGTVVCASLWSEIAASEEAEERYNELSPKVNMHSYLCLQVYTQVVGIFIPFLCSSFPCLWDGFLAGLPSLQK